ncbi:hypothetical protein [Streptomyces sp. NPDC020330]|uniref:hypothetical protein n=1 Tax=unclassified Streptomyces TaxID=2593676 RepID=UPI00379ACE16
MAIGAPLVPGTMLDYWAFTCPSPLAPKRFPQLLGNTVVCGPTQPFVRLTDCRTVTTSISTRKRNGAV